MVWHSSQLRVHHLEVPGSKHHISPAFRQKIRFALCRFRSPLLTASLLLSLPAGTKMFQFPAFPIAYSNHYGFTVAGCPIRESPVQRLLAPTRGLSQLGTPFISARAKPFTRWRSSSSLRPGCVCIISLEL